MNRDLRERVWAAVDEAWDEQVAFHRELVTYPSTLFNERPVQQFMQYTFQEMGLQVDAFDADISLIGRLPGYSPVEWGYQGRPQVVGVWPSPGGGGRSLVLNGHVDVVSPEPLRQWNHDPYGARIIGDRMYGRGALDMKSGVAANVFALRALQRAGLELQGDVILHSVIEEECTGNGTLACLARGYVGDGALVTDSLGQSILVGEVGVLWLRMVVRGAAGHVAGASEHVNAIENTYYLIGALRELEAEWNRQGHPAFAGQAHPINFNPGVIRGGDWASTVPSECELVTRLSFFPGVTPEEAKAAILDHLRQAVHRHAFLSAHPPEFSWFGHHDEGYWTPNPTENPVAATLAPVHTAVTRRPVRYLHSTAVTDTRFWPLYYGKPAVCYGAEGGNAHAPNEWVDLGSVRELTKVVAGFILDWCGEKVRKSGA